MSARRFAAGALLAARFRARRLSSPRNATNSDSTSEGYMFEKSPVLDVDQAGSGGEYSVQDDGAMSRSRRSYIGDTEPGAAQRAQPT
ncbi:hypothetical protein BDV93DRAFT_567140 [Ceratobasidium sp. AG-I]|nr:hypothetical protein BDV93DRAFT_567140 [Ceratobasidium sp. AG-I]